MRRAAARWCACARSCPAWVRAAPLGWRLPRVRSLAIRRPVRRCGRRLALLGFRGTLRFRILRRGRGVGRLSSLSLLLLLLFDLALVQILGHALFEAWHALGEHRLAIAWQLLLGVEEVQQIGRIEAAAAGAAAKHPRKRDEDGSCDQTLRSAHGRSLKQLSVSRRQLLATGGSKACNASARERRLGGVSPSSSIMSSHFRAAAASLAR